VNELQRLISSNGAFTPPLRIVDAIAPEFWNARPAGVPHSIAEELWHIVYWIEHSLSWIRCELLPYPDSSEEGWRTFGAMTSDEWNSLLARFRQALDEAVDFAAGPLAVLSGQLTTLNEPGIAPLTVHEVLVNIAVHNAYHLGRVVQLRQMLGIWPPPGGGDCW
jgi:uncharacterized damage-inducible protein DinB